MYIYFFSSFIFFIDFFLPAAVPSRSFLSRPSLPFCLVCFLPASFRSPREETKTKPSPTLRSSPTPNAPWGSPTWGGDHRNATPSILLPSPPPCAAWLLVGFGVISRHWRCPSGHGWALQSATSSGLSQRRCYGALLREEVAQLQEEVHLLRQMKEMLTKELEETHGSKSPEVLSATELKVQLAQKEQELARAKEALQAMKADRKRLKAEKTDLVSQMQQLYATLESREEQLRDFIRNYEQHRKESEDAVKALAKEKDLLEREKWELRRQAKEATDHASALRSQLDLKDNRMKELEAELAMAKQSLATLTKDVPKRHSLAMPGETVLNGNQEWVLQADLPLTAAIRQSQQTLYHSHPAHSADRQAVRVSPCHSRQPSIISDASAAEGDRSSTPSDINSPRHRTHSLCNGDSPGPVQKNLHNPIVQSLEDLEDQKRKKKKEKMGFGSISRVFARGKQRKSLDPGLFDGTAPDYYIEEDADW
uniref:Kazrin, periplakin interacting protein n=1 Tax=Gallus gallus TaxID=9031 RepID=A0A8V0ZGS8_CHICK